MDAVIKVGGSLAETPEALRTLCKTLSQLDEKYKIVVVPGGGEFADLVRDMDKRYSLPSIAAHRMAVLGMDQFGFLLLELIPHSRGARSFMEAREILQSNKTVVLLPYQLISEVELLEPSWDVTSDSIAAYVADQMQAPKLVLITNADGLFTSDPKTNPDAQLIKTISASGLLERNKRTCVDKFLPNVLLESSLKCFIVNGNHPERVKKILANKRTICTQILTKGQARL